MAATMANKDDRQHLLMIITILDLPRFLDFDKRIDIFQLQARLNWQEMMRILHQKSQYPGLFTRGLTRGSGMTEEMQTPGILFATSEHNSAIQDFTDLTFTTSPQHKDSTEAFIKEDSSDLEKMQAQITTCSPYTADLTMRNMRFLVVSTFGDPSLAVVLSYELSSHPVAFFEAKNILRTADKPQIAQAI
ncbi:hypothetical protein DPMN_055539 [Dreissena polymorpha]|uniref:Uncharacterized protein n=1 Tax=Dreissena polymorpha TaxID=45954 RepID=A0A9D4HU66_DREPO|nr:hypothetical protein DPMN_055539 [Dreissena polymorpha]